MTLTLVKRSETGGFGASSHEQIIDHTVSMYKDVPAYILDKLMQKFHNDFHHYGYTFDVETKIPGGFFVKLSGMSSMHDLQSHIIRIYYFYDTCMYNQGKKC